MWGDCGSRCLPVREDLQFGIKLTWRAVITGLPSPHARLTAIVLPKLHQNP